MYKHSHKFLILFVLGSAHFSLMSMQKTKDTQDSTSANAGANVVQQAGKEVKQAADAAQVQVEAKESKQDAALKKTLENNKTFSRAVARFKVAPMKHALINASRKDFEQFTQQMENPYTAQYRKKEPAAKQVVTWGRRKITFEDQRIQKAEQLHELRKTLEQKQKIQWRELLKPLLAILAVAVCYLIDNKLEAAQVLTEQAFGEQFAQIQQGKRQLIDGQLVYTKAVFLPMALLASGLIKPSLLTYGLWGLWSQMSFNRSEAARIKETIAEKEKERRWKIVKIERLRSPAARNNVQRAGVESLSA